jgi:hypothetical protein
MKHLFAFALVFLFASSATAQHFEAAQPSGREHGGFFAVPRGVAGEVAATVRDFATFRDKQWEILTLAQIGAASADAETSLYNMRNDPSMKSVCPGFLSAATRTRTNTSSRGWWKLRWKLLRAITCAITAPYKNGTGAQSGRCLSRLPSTNTPTPAFTMRGNH